MKLPTQSLYTLAAACLLAPMAYAQLPPPIIIDPPEVAPVPVADPVSLTAPADLRIVEGAAFAPLQFSAINSDPAYDSTFDINLTAGSAGSLIKLSQPDAEAPDGLRVDLATGTPWTGATLLMGNTGTLSTQADLSGKVAGDVVSFGIEATSTSWTQSFSASSSINVVQNRLLTGSVTIDAGRHIAGLQPVGSVTLNGGTLTDTEGTRIAVNSGGFAQLANGLRLTSDSNFTFDGADQTHDLQIAYYGPTGNYTLSSTLPGAGGNTYTDAAGAERQEFGGTWQTSAEYGNVLGETKTFSAPDSTAWLKPEYPYHTGSAYIYTSELVETAQPAFSETKSAYYSYDRGPSGVNTPWELSRGDGALVNERVNPLIGGEVIGGSSLDLSGVSIEVTGTAVANRRIYGGTVELGRRMVGAANESISRTDNVVLSTSGTDEHRTRLNLGSFSLDDGSITAALDAGTTGIAFTDGSHTAEVAVTGNFTIDTSVLGRVTQTVNAGSFITGEGLTGETVQSNLSLGYAWNNVQNNKLKADNLLVIDYSDRTDSRSYSTDVWRENYTDTHTAIGASTNQVIVTGTKTAGMYNLGSTSISAIAEGLAGEDTSQGGTSFNTRYASIDRAAVAVTHDGAADGPLTDGDVITISDQGSGLYQAHSAISQVNMSGGEKLDYELTFAGGSPVIGHGESRTFTVGYVGDASTPLAGAMSRVSRADLSIGLADRVDVSGIYAAAGSPSAWTREYAGGNLLGSSLFHLETRFDAPAATSGTSTVSAGSNLGSNGLALDNTAGNTSGRFSVATSMEFLASETLTSNTSVQVDFLSIDSATADVVGALENEAANAASIAGIYGGQNMTSEFASEIVEVTGLDGILHVLQVDYNDTGLNYEGGAQLLWQTTYDDGGETKIAWVNAVLGNSNITNLDLLAGTLTVGDTSGLIADYLEATRFEGGYEAYLLAGELSAPELGAWGFDVDSNQVWAAIDHNSSFVVAVPEPGALSLLGFAALAGMMIRRRS